MLSFGLPLYRSSLLVFALQSMSNTAHRILVYHPSRDICSAAFFQLVLCHCRHYLAVMHWNENANRGQKINSIGQLAYQIIHPKAKKGQYSLRVLKDKPTYSE